MNDYYDNLKETLYLITVTVLAKLVIFITIPPWKTIFTESGYSIHCREGIYVNPHFICTVGDITCVELNYFICKN